MNLLRSGAGVEGFVFAADPRGDMVKPDIAEIDEIPGNGAMVPWVRYYIAGEIFMANCQHLSVIQMTLLEEAPDADEKHCAKALEVKP